MPTAGESSRIAGLSQCTPHFSFGLAKRETGRARSKEKKRFGGSVCAGADLLPPAGDGWRSLAAVRDGNARPLGASRPGDVQGYPLRLFPLPLTLPRRTRQRLAERKARKEEQIKCDLAPRPTSHPPPRDGSHNLAEESSVPEGKPKSEQAPVRRPPSRAEGHCTGARPSAFSLPPGAARSLFGAAKGGSRRALRGGERRSKGAGAVFAAGGNGA